MEAKKPMVVWSMKRGEQLQPFWCGMTRKETIRNFVSECGETWEHWKKKHGYTCVKVTVTEIGKS